MVKCKDSWPYADGVVCDMYSGFYLARVLRNAAVYQKLVMHIAMLPHFVHAGSVPDVS